MRVNARHKNVQTIAQLLVLTNGNSGEVDSRSATCRLLSLDIQASSTHSCRLHEAGRAWSDRSLASEPRSQLLHRDGFLRYPHPNASLNRLTSLLLFTWET